MGCCAGEKKEGDEKWGESRTYDQQFRGIAKNRSCTDVLCCIFLFLYIAAYLIVAIFAWINGNPLILFYPTDSQGRICGVRYNDLDLSNKTSLIYFDISKCSAAVASLKFQCPTTQVCVPDCPTTYWSYVEEEVKLSVMPGLSRADKADIVDWSKFICNYGYNPLEAYRDDNVELQTMMLEEKCVPYYVPSEAVAGRCIPMISEGAGLINSSTNAAIQNAAKMNITSTNLLEGVTPIKYFLEARSIANKIFADLTVVWVWILLLMCVAALISFIWIVVMRWIAGPMVWITLLTLIAVTSVGIYISYLQWTTLKDVPETEQDRISNQFKSGLSAYFTMQQLWLALMIICSIIDFILIVTVIFLRERIAIAIGIIRQSSKAIDAMISTLFYPLVSFVLILIVVGFWAMTALFLASTGDPIYKYSDNRVITNTSVAAAAQNLTGEKCNVVEFQNDTSLSSQPGLMCEFIEYGGESVFHQNVFWLQVVELFGMLWFMNWVLALGQMTLAGAFCSWYWAFKKPRDVPMFALYQSFGRALRFHTGTLAFGSFIIAVVQLIRIMLEYIDHKLKNKQNKVAKFIMTCLKCCFWCLESFLKFINRNAYIMTAMYGKNFCWSAKEAFQLLMRNILRVVILDKMVDIILFIGKLVVVAIMGVLSWALFAGFLNFPIPTLNYYWMPIVITVVASYVIASGFFNTFGMAADTIFLCFLEDLERNDGSPEKPYFMARKLLKTLGKKNAIQERPT